LILPRFELLRPRNLSEALELLEKYGSDAAPLAGGTELLVLLRNKAVKPKYLVDLNPLRSQLSYVKVEDGVVRIGALTTPWEIQESALGRDMRYAGFKDVFEGFATMALRFHATIGGNIATATQYSDYITLLLAFDADVKLASASGERVVKLENLLVDKRKLDKKPGELIVEISFPEPRSNCSSSFMKFDRRKLLIAGIVTGAAFMCLENGKIADVRVSFDMVRDKRVPARAKMVEEFLKGREFSEDLLVKASEEVLPREMVRVTDWWTTAEYRLEMSKVVLRRNLLRVYERIGGGV